VCLISPDFTYCIKIKILKYDTTKIEKNNDQNDSKHDRYISIVTNLILYSGLVIIITGLIYMIFNLSRADSIIKIWLPFMIVGVALVFVSQLIKWQYLKPSR